MCAATEAGQLISLFFFCAATEVGPLISPAAKARVEAVIGSAKEQGAQLVLDGR